MSQVKSEVALGPALRGIGRRVFPGDRRVWIVAAGVLAVALAIVAVALLKPREDLLGTNSVGARSAIAIVPAGATLCVPHLRVPAGTGQIQFLLDTRNEPRPALEVQVREAGGRILRGTSPPSPLGGHHPYSVAIPRLPAAPAFVVADVCLTPRAQIFVWGNANPQDNIPSPILAGTPIPDRVGVWFLGPRGASRSIASQIGEMFRRAALFRPGFVGAWTYWVLLALVFPALAYAAVRLLATADLERPRRLPPALAVGMIAFGVAASWSLITPSFESADESEHFAYVQYFAETGKAVETVQTARPPYSTSEGFALEGVFHTSTIERPDTRPPWLRADEREYDDYLAAHRLPRDDGGGFHPAISTHTPAYYSLLAPGYLLTRHDSVWSQLLAMRLTSALMGALVAIMAMLTVRELLPDRRGLAVAAGLLVAFEPMFASIAGAVNNDNGVNAAAALLIYMVIRALRRGLGPRLAVALGATLVAAPLLKGTGYELYPTVALGLVFVIWRRHGRRDLTSLALLAATFLALQLGWGALSSTVHHTTFTTPGGVTPGSTFEAFHNPKRYISWLARVMLPFTPPFVHHDWTIIHWPFFNIYIERGFASFGWYAVYFPKWVYLAVVSAIAAAALLGLSLLVRERRLARRFWPEIAVLTLVPIVVICAVEAAFQPSVSNLPITGTPEEGRYAFPAIVAVAALFVGACLGVRRARALPLAAAAVAGMIALNLASQLLMLSAFYT